MDPELAAAEQLFPDVDVHDYRFVRKLDADYSASLRSHGLDGRYATSVSVTEAEAAGLDGKQPPVPLRLYRPVGAPPRGLVIFLHGGGFVAGDLDSEHERCLEWASECNCVVASVGYRLAPEHPCPAALADVWAAFVWASSTWAELALDRPRFAVAGVSAGGALAAGLVARVRDEGLCPAPLLQVLLYPALDDRLQTDSIRSFFDYRGWNGRNTGRMWQLYLAGCDPEVIPYAVPARQRDLRGLPAAYIITAEADPLRDEAIRYATRLLEAGVPTELHQYAHTFHAFDHVTSAEIASRAIAEQVYVIKRAFRQ